VRGHLIEVTPSNAHQGHGAHIHTQPKEEMKMAETTLAKACMDYFSPSRKLTTMEYKELTHQDKVELREMFIAEGMEIAPLAPPKTDET
jgi:hypothetical protein